MNLPDFKVLVCITPQSNSRRLIDKGVETAAGGGELHIVYVQKGGDIFAEEASLKLLQELYDYGAGLGGIIHGLLGEDVIATLENFIKDESITHVVLGAPPENALKRSIAVIERLEKDLPQLKFIVLER